MERGENGTFKRSSDGAEGMASRHAQHPACRDKAFNDANRPAIAVAAAGIQSAKKACTSASSRVRGIGGRLARNNFP
jgi:hypothetical protein